MRGHTLVVFHNGARVLRIALRLLDIAGGDLAVPQDVVGDEQPARPEQRDEPIQQRRIELLVAVLKNQIERP